MAANWELIRDIVYASPIPLSYANLLIAFKEKYPERNSINVRPDAAMISVNSPSRIHYGGCKKARICDEGHKYDCLFINHNKEYEKYQPEKHGVWAIIQSSSGELDISCLISPHTENSKINNPVSIIKGNACSTSTANKHPMEVNMKDNCTIIIPAAPIRQGELTLFATSMRVRDLISEGFYCVETLDPEDSGDKGYQRLLNKARAKKLADYIQKGQDSQDAFLPTSIFLATDKSIDFNSENHTITINPQQIGPFSVVDGQHRLEGLRMAAEKDERVLDFEVPVNIAIRLSKIAQMCHFLIVNSTQKSVDKSVEQRIFARLSEALEVEDLPSLPKWILNTAQKGEIDKAIKIVDYLNSNPESPWHAKIHMANQGPDSTTINQQSFVKAIVKYILTASNPLSIINDLDKEKRIFLNYWTAIRNILDDGNSTVLYKYNGVELFCKFSTPFFMKLQDKGSFKISSMEKLLFACFENMEGEYAGVGHPEWWTKGGKASFMNSGAINMTHKEMCKALHAASMSDGIEI